MDEVTGPAHGATATAALPVSARATLRDVARAAGVSHTTVSNAFARPDQLSAPLRAHVLATARALGYAGPSPAARSLRTGRHGALGLVFSEDLPYAFSDPTATQFLQGVAEACRERAANLLLIATRTGERAGDGGDDSTLGGSPALRDAAVDGVIVYSLASDSAMLDPIAARRLPLVVVDQPRLPGVAFVGIDDEGAARAIAEHLLGLGHRRFVILSLKLCPDGREGIADARRTAGATYEVAAARLAGYRGALAAAGVDPATVPVVECARNDERRARELLAPLLATARPTTRPTAVLAMSDRLALGAVSAARAAGLAIPGDVSVVGFDDVAVDGAGEALPLTTVRQPHAGKGRAAVERLGAATTGGARVLATELVVRASSGPAPTAGR
ncbi:MAG TPA: LacI family DNA-binding transcriptional regulator [Gemmatirosa sp.]